MKKQLVAGAMALAVAGAGATTVTAQNPALPQLDVDIKGSRIAFEGTPQIGTGFHRLTLENKGRGEAGVVLVKLKPGVTVEQFGKVAPKIKDHNAVEKYGTAVASNFWNGPSTYTTTLRLEDADYAFVDMTKRPAVRLGFHAGPQAGDAGATPPAPDAEVKLRDYRFAMPSTLKAGKSVIRTSNVGDEMHHALVMPLKKGVNTRKVVRDLKAGKEPRNAIGGPPSALVELVSGGTTNDVEVDLRKGKYLFVCFLQDTPKSKPHSMLGMEKIVTVR